MKLRTKENTKGQMMQSNLAVELVDNRQKWLPYLRLIGRFKLPWIWIILTILGQLFGGQLALMFPDYTMRIFSGEFTLQLAIAATVVSILRSILTAVNAGVREYTVNKNLYCMQTAVWKKLPKLPLSFFQKNEPRELITRITRDMEGFSSFMGFVLAVGIGSVYAFVGSLAMLFTYDWRLAVSQLAILPLHFLVVYIAGRIYFKLNSRLQARVSDIARYLSAVMPSMLLVKLFGQEKREEENGMNWIFNNYKTTLSNQIITQAIGVGQSLVALARELIVVFTGLWLIREGAIDGGIYVAFWQYSNIFYGGFTGMMQNWEIIKKNQGNLARVALVMDTPDEANPGTKDARKTDGAIEFKNVTFAYEEKNVLENVSFSVEPGKFTAIVGPSGAGKSTVLKLVERFYDPASGQITLAGDKADAYELGSWRQSLGLISQRTNLFSGTIRENIVYGVDREVTEAELMEAARGADALEFIQAFPDGFDTQVGESGSKLSGGQRQRIAIARALLMDTKVLVLDEATANLDAESEHNVNKTLESLSKDHTILMVAHHMDAVKNADKIVVMENGRVAAQGDHAELMASCQLYRRMVELQSAKAAV